MTTFYEICYATDEEIKNATLLSDIKGEVVGTVGVLSQAIHVVGALGDAFFYRKVETDEPAEIITRVKSILKQVEVMYEKRRKESRGNV